MQLSKDLIMQFKNDYEKDPAHKTIAGAIARTGLQEASINNETLRIHNFYFSNETKRGEITSQNPADGVGCLPP